MGADGIAPSPRANLVNRRVLESRDLRRVLGRSQSAYAHKSCLQVSSLRLPRVGDKLATNILVVKLENLASTSDYKYQCCSAPDRSAYQSADAWQKKEQGNGHRFLRVVSIPRSDSRAGSSPTTKSSVFARIDEHVKLFPFKTFVAPDVS
jgi:hypothetical protein